MMSSLNSRQTVRSDLGAVLTDIIATVFAIEAVALELKLDNLIVILKLIIRLHMS